VVSGSLQKHAKRAVCAIGTMNFLLGRIAVLDEEQCKVMHTMAVPKQQSSRVGLAGFDEEPKVVNEKRNNRRTNTHHRKDPSSRVCILCGLFQRFHVFFPPTKLNKTVFLSRISHKRATRSMGSMRSTQNQERRKSYDTNPGWNFSLTWSNIMHFK